MFTLSRIGSYDPFEDMTTGFELLRPRRGEVVAANLGQGQGQHMLAMDMHEDDKGFDAIFNVPGVAKDNVKIELDERVLTVSADYKREAKDDGTNPKFHWKERSEGHVKRSIQLPASADLDKISAKQAEGVLTVHIPKHEEKPNKARSITIK